MTKKISSIRGMNDILPGDTGLWQYLEKIIRETMQAYNYQEIRFPIVEKTALFKRSIGEVTDIVEKEMYTFDDRNQDSLTLRPEGTAVCVRAMIENGLIFNQQHRLWYNGPMFRYERPQKGRYRQFHQFGIETFGFFGPQIDLELLAIGARLWKRLQLDQEVRLEINSLGNTESRDRYRDALIEYFLAHKESLDEDSLRRLESNPLRILDSKNPTMQEIIANAPILLDYLDEESSADLEFIQQGLQALAIPYTLNPRLVRGLDYYNKLVFEWVTDKLGAQGTVCAGGRYDGLVEQLGGRTTPAVGMAMGMERLLELIADKALFTPPQLDVIWLFLGERANQQGMQWQEKLRDELPDCIGTAVLGGGSFKSQMKKADKSNARIAIILADDELNEQKFTLKFLRKDEQVEQQQLKLSWQQLVQLLEKLEL